jgi:hypothetical protein
LKSSGHPELAVEQTQPALPSRPLERPEPGHRPASLRNHELLARLRPVQEREKCVFAACTLTVSMRLSP